MHPYASEAHNRSLRTKSSSPVCRLKRKTGGTEAAGRDPPFEDQGKGTRWWIKADGQEMGRGPKRDAQDECAQMQRLTCPAKGGRSHDVAGDKGEQNANDCHTARQHQRLCSLVGLDWQDRLRGYHALCQS